MVKKSSQLSEGSMVRGTLAVDQYLFLSGPLVAFLPEDVLRASMCHLF